MAISTYPVRVEASLDPHISRWLWLVKWLLAVPHYIILSVLWVAFFVVSVIAFFAIALTGKYPPSLFDFNVGVLRWSWRVHYYTFGALATDEYPPFTLADVPDYPAHLEISYPEHLSRGLVWVKWWLLAIPHYIVVGIFLGGGAWTAEQFGNSNLNWLGGGLIGVLVLIAAVVLLVTGQYPRQIFDLVLGLNRWVLRVAAYAGLMTDEYPPFRLDVGGHEPSDTLTLTAPARPIQEWSPATPEPGPDSGRRGWTGGRIASLVAGSLLALVSVGLLAAGGVATWADNTQRDASGYLTTGTHTFATGAPALTSGQINLGSRADAFTPSDFLGTVRFRVTPADPQTPLFVGIARDSAASQFLSGVRHDEITNWANGTVAHRNPAAGATANPPATAAIWAVQSAGTGTRTITWKPGPGSWTVVVMNTSAAPGVVVTADIGATLPDLGWIAAGLLAGGGVLLLVAGALVLVPVIRASK